MKILLLVLLLPLGQTPQEKAKSAFDSVVIDYNDVAKKAFDKCECQNCDCKDCKCEKGCDCTTCNSFDAVYKKAIKDNKAVVLAVACPKIESQLWRVVEVPSITGEQPGYIVGVPKDGQLIRLDFPPDTTKLRIRLDILHVYYPLTAGYQECATCPYGRVWIGRR